MNCRVKQIIIVPSDLESSSWWLWPPSGTYPLFAPVSGLIPPSKGNGAFSSSSECLGGISAIIYYVITGNVIFDVKNKTGENSTF